MRKGFTLIEVLIVVIIIGILATIAIPQFANVAEKARIGEATTHMSSYATAERLYELDNGQFGSQAQLTTAGDVNVPDPAKYWDYSIANTGTTFDITATRRGTGDYGGDTITLDENGVWAGTHPFRPTND